MGIDGLSSFFLAELYEPRQLSDITPWDVDFRQISSGSGHTSVSVRMDSEISAMSLKMRCNVHQRGESPKDFITFGVPRAGSVTAWFGRDVPPVSMYCFGSGKEFDAVSQNGFDGHTTSFERQSLVRAAKDFGFGDCSSLLSVGLIDLSQSQTEAANYSQAVDQFVNTSGTTPDLIDEDDICLAVLEAAATSSVVVAEENQRARDKALRRALEAIDSHLDENLTIRQLCILSETSWTTLRRAFLEQFSIGPKRYLLLLRLNRVRTELIAMGKDVRIVDAANKWGFWHMGQFARDYKKHFGLLPSQDHMRRV